MSTTAAPTRSRVMPTIVAGLAALLLVSALVVRTSQAAFTANTTSPGNAFSAGVVNLTNTRTANGALFTVAGLAPGNQVEDCVTVTYSGSVNTLAAVKLYMGGAPTQTAGPGGASNLSDHLLVTIVEASGGSCAAPTGTTTLVSGATLSSLAAGHTNYTNGLTGWTPAGGASASSSRLYKFTVQLSPTAPNTLQGASVTGAGFVWEVLSA